MSEVLEVNVIEHTTSSYNAPIFLVLKKSGEWRVVVVFRELNKITIPDRYPMPASEVLLQ